ncbi:hypothetical protein BGX38DRAFT_1274363 [Terfezia claveryi]|nr:hypothetical protein BGX38DRAFT_1274363 [Terfezia claveryi]
MSCAILGLSRSAFDSVGICIRLLEFCGCKTEAARGFWVVVCALGPARGTSGIDIRGPVLSRILSSRGWPATQYHSVVARTTVALFTQVLHYLDLFGLSDEAWPMTVDQSTIDTIEVPSNIEAQSDTTTLLQEPAPSTQVLQDYPDLFGLSDEAWPMTVDQSTLDTIEVPSNVERTDSGQVESACPTGDRYKVPPAWDRYFLPVQ